MKIAIGVNHAWPHVGGCEVVVHQVASRLVKMGHRCRVFSFTTKKSVVHEGVEYFPCGMTPTLFLSALCNYNPDELLVYSDCFRYWPNVIEHATRFDFGTTIVPVGLNMMAKSRILMSRFIEKREHFKVITHSDNYQDFVTTKGYGFNPIVIPNGVDLQEFNVDYGLFRNKYNINTENLAVYVANFFPGKGHEALIEIVKQICKERKDTTFVVISSNAQTGLGANLELRFKMDVKRSGLPIRLLSGISREDTVSAFIDADVLTFVSQQEVAPITILEAMAAQTPWVALPVGNVPTLPGGIMVGGCAVDKTGKYIYSKKTHAAFAREVNNILDNEQLSDVLTGEGRNAVEGTFNWDIIVPQYEKFFLEKNN